MKQILKYAGAIGIAGVVALAAATPSQARDGWRTGAAVAGGFAAGAVVGAAAASANNGYYYGPGYGYYEPGYAYEPTYDYGYAYEPAPTYTYSYGRRGWGNNGGPYSNTNSVNERSR